MSDDDDIHELLVQSQSLSLEEPDLLCTSDNASFEVGCKYDADQSTMRYLRNRKKKVEVQQGVLTSKYSFTST